MRAATPGRHSARQRPSWGRLAVLPHLGVAGPETGRPGQRAHGVGQAHGLLVIQGLQRLGHPPEVPRPGTCERLGNGGLDAPLRLWLAQYAWSICRDSYGSRCTRPHPISSTPQMPTTPTARALVQLAGTGSPAAPMAYDTSTVWVGASGLTPMIQSTFSVSVPPSPTNRSRLTPFGSASGATRALGSHDAPMSSSSPGSPGAAAPTISVTRSLPSYTEQSTRPLTPGTVAEDVNWSSAGARPPYGAHCAGTTCW